MAKVVGDIAIAVEAETAGLISGLNSGKVSVADFGVKVEQMGKRLKRAEAQSRGMGGAFRSLGNVSNRTRAQIQNTSFQLQDIAVQLQGGTRASTVFAQQLPQLAGAFGPVGAVIGVLAGVGIPALAFAFGGLGQEADELAEKMKAVADAKTKLNEQLRVGYTGSTAEELTLLDAIKEKVGEIAISERNLALARGAINRRQYKAQLENNNEELAGLKAQLAELRRLQDARARLVSSTVEMSNQERLLGDSMRTTGAELAKNEALADLLRQGLSASAIEALELAGVDIATGVDAASKAAAELAANLNISLKEALRLKALSADPLDAFGGLGPFIPEHSAPWDAPEMGGGGRGGGGRSGGGGGASSGPSQASLDALRESFATEHELLQINFDKKLAQLEEFRRAKMLKDGEFDELEQKARQEHLAKVDKLERDSQAARLQSIGGALGDAASLMQSGNSKLFKIGQAAAVAEAVVSGYSAAVSAWEKGMKVGGPPAAAAFTAASLARTGSLIAGIKSQSASGSGGGVTAAATSQAAPVVNGTREFTVIGNNVLGLGELVSSINDAVDQGYQIKIGMGA